LDGSSALLDKHRILAHLRVLTYRVNKARAELDLRKVLILLRRLGSLNCCYRGSALSELLFISVNIILDSFLKCELRVLCSLYQC
jgi:hypothetical protein